MFSIKACKIYAGPFSLFFTWWFLTVLLPQLTPELKSSIMDGTLGTIFGFFGGASVVACCVESWKETSSLFHKSNTIN